MLVGFGKPAAHLRAVVRPERSGNVWAVGADRRSALAKHP